eukprot:3117655-Heterocapsa_arctica.AAC.1
MRWHVSESRAAQLIHSAVDELEIALALDKSSPWRLLALAAADVSEALADLAVLRSAAAFQDYLALVADEEC